MLSCLPLSPQRQNKNSWETVHPSATVQHVNPKILSLPEERIAAELNKFYNNTVDGHKNNSWKNVQDSTKASDLRNKPERHLVKEVSSRVVPELRRRSDGDVEKGEASSTLDQRLRDDSNGCASVDIGVLGNMFIPSAFLPSTEQTGNGKMDSWSLSDYCSHLLILHLKC
ncbi:hypothetical protein TIFTF001_000103 [Ficus carica]|uniref:Uncharacterized protein n=1 Tax=Ficus carica TaxID=3494 RepID=A0AA88CME2_FICCA|nr:hypothetical protein TIFTF001_000103 [Ficus carica]